MNRARVQSTKAFTLVLIKTPAYLGQEFRLIYLVFCLPALLLVPMQRISDRIRRLISSLLSLPAWLLVPTLLLLLPPIHSLQLLLLPLLLGPSVWSLVLSNTLYALAFSVYFYITHLGYRCENRKPPRPRCRSGGLVHVP